MCVREGGRKLVRSREVPSKGNPHAWQDCLLSLSAGLLPFPSRAASITVLRPFHRAQTHSPHPNLPPPTQPSVGCSVTSPPHHPPHPLAAGAAHRCRCRAPGCCGRVRRWPCSHAGRCSGGWLRHQAVRRRRACASGLLVVGAAWTTCVRYTSGLLRMRISASTSACRVTVSMRAPRRSPLATGVIPYVSYIPHCCTKCKQSRRCLPAAHIDRPDPLTRLHDRAALLLALLRKLQPDDAHAVALIRRHG